MLQLIYVKVEFIMTNKYATIALAGVVSVGSVVALAREAEAFCDALCFEQLGVIIPAIIDNRREELGGEPKTPEPVEVTVYPFDTTGLTPEQIKIMADLTQPGAHCNWEWRWDSSSRLAPGPRLVRVYPNKLAPHLPVAGSVGVDVNGNKVRWLDVMPEYACPWANSELSPEEKDMIRYARPQRRIGAAGKVVVTNASTFFEVYHRDITFYEVLLLPGRSKTVTLSNPLYQGKQCISNTVGKTKLGATNTTIYCSTTPS